MAYGLSQKLKSLALDLLFPPWCVGCGSAGQFICPRCRESLPRIQPPVCSRCGKPQPREGLCPGCWGWQANIDGIRAPFRFEGTIREAVHSLKYRNLRALGVLLARFMADFLAFHVVPGDVLVAVPLHPARLRDRGFNQSELLTAELGRLTGMPEERGLLLRHRNTPPQVGTSSADIRRENVAGAFTCRDKRLKGRKVILVDDVCTSGATLNACAAALKCGGASTVWGLTLARES